MRSLPPRRTDRGPTWLRETRADIQALSEYCAGITPRSSPTVRVNHQATGVTYEALGGGGGSGRLAQMLVKEIKEDYLLCVVVDIQADGVFAEIGSQVKVAKPHDLRWSTWNNESNAHWSWTDPNPISGDFLEADQPTAMGKQERDAIGASGGTITDTDETAVKEYVFPPYIADETVIYAAELSETCTVKHTVDTNEDGAPDTVQDEVVTWVDVNADARRWDYPVRDLSYCISGSRKRIRLHVSTAFEPVGEAGV